ncbi:UPF0223 protein BH2638 [Paraliobacillus ryukyuensis]|uniref:UPF0223 protein DES48_11816 n=1 Tax=Paraliobacillus ryukyuensis TaxID=200904 RepID=A0A366DPN0_9BACI|nr:UPF0223 family protein [Paraliobacillus ryukyuensis]RBO92036.1 uncharacterized protein YktA (UPF0223 family) [Paraliobacillus ryukyuensis]
MNYSYPIDESWSTNEVIDVVNFLSLVEKAYEQSVKRNDLILAYRRFKQIVPSKSEEKQIDKQFEKETGYSVYRTVQHARKVESDKINIRP